VFRLRGGPPREVWLSLIVLVFTLGAFGAYGAGWLLREIWPALAQRNPDQFTIGSPVGGVYWLMLTLLPKYVYFRYPAKLLPLVALAISQLAARGLDEIAVRPRSRLRKVLFTLGCGSGVLAAALWFIGSRCSNDIAQRLFAWCAGPARFASIDWNDHLVGPFDAAGAYHDVLLALIQTAIVAIAGWWLLSRLAKDGRTQARWNICFVLLTAADVAFANGWLVATAPVDAWRGEPAIAALAQSNAASDASAVELPPRVLRANLATWRPASFSRTKSRTRPAEIIQWEHDTLFPKHHLANGLALVESYGSVKWADYDSLLSVAKQYGPQQPDKSLLPQPTALRLLGTEFLVLPEAHRPDFAHRIVSRGTAEGAALWRMNRTLPRAWIVHDVEVAPELPSRRRRASIDRRTYDVLFPEGRPRDFLKSAVIETNRPPPELKTTALLRPPSDLEVAAERCEITHYSPQRVVVQVDLNQAGLVVLSDAWDPGWRAFVTSGNSINDARIYRTNRVLRGVWLPAGKHTIEYRFRPQSFLCGALISCLSWTLLTIALIAGLRLNKRSWRAS